MAAFGLPGGAEWLVILVILGLLFVPGIAVFWFGYLTGKSAGMRQASSTPPDASVAPSSEASDE